MHEPELTFAEIISGARIIPLTQGAITFVDAEDFERLMQWKWSVSSGYARRGCSRKEGNGRTRNVFMHRVITDAPKGMVVDHRDRNGLNNRRFNLRVGTHAQNLWNKGPRCDSKSGIKGVNWNPRRRQWRVRITANKQVYHIGWFKEKSEAIRAYANAAKRLHGEYCNVSDQSCECV